MRRRGLQRVTRRRDDELARLDPSAFEALIADYYRGLGYQVERIGLGGAHFDGGIDLELRRGAEFVIVQCKRENAYQVPHNVGHELIGVMCTRGATGAVLVNTGEFTRHARQSASFEPRLTLVDGDEVRRWFPELAQPESHPYREPVSSGGMRPRDVRRDGTGNDGAKAMIWLAALVALMAWQCSRPALPRRAASTAVSTAVAPVVSAKQAVGPPPAPIRTGQTSRPAIERLSPEELEAWKRGNEESMKILERTTPEFGIAPNAGEVLQ